MEGLEAIVREHPFFAGLEEEFIKLIAGCAKNVRFDAGQYLFHEGEPADQFYLVRHGRVALEISGARPRRDHLPDGRRGRDRRRLLADPALSLELRRASALELTRAIAMDAACLRGKCEADHDLGYEMMKRFMPVLVQRLQATRLQISTSMARHA